MFCFVFGGLIQDIMYDNFFAKMDTVIPPILTHMALCNVTLNFFLGTSQVVQW